jgi:hypothetical protein
VKHKGGGTEERKEETEKRGTKGRKRMRRRGWYHIY